MLQPQVSDTSAVIDRRQSSSHNKNSLHKKKQKTELIFHSLFNKYHINSQSINLIDSFNDFKPFYLICTVTLCHTFLLNLPLMLSNRFCYIFLLYILSFILSCETFCDQKCWINRGYEASHSSEMQDDEMSEMIKCCQSKPLRHNSEYGDIKSTIRAVDLKSRLLHVNSTLCLSEEIPVLICANNKACGSSLCTTGAVFTDSCLLMQVRLSWF